MKIEQFVNTDETLPLELTGPISAVELLGNIRPSVASVDYAWKKVRSAGAYLQKQIAAYFEQEAA